MRVLLDEQLPRRLARHLPDHYVRTVQQEGWSGLRNGDLLRRATAGGFDSFVTGDQNLRFQQNLSELNLALIVLTAASNRFGDLLPPVPELLIAIRGVRPGELRRVAAN